MIGVNKISYKGLNCVQIMTSTCEYYYDFDGGGFCSIIDKYGNDWINYSHKSGSKGLYRGIPNMVYPEGYFHPGYGLLHKPMESEIVVQGPEEVWIRTRSHDQRWSVVWYFYDGYAQMIVERANGPFWFLYEGTPGGDISKDNYMLLSNGDRYSIGDSWTQRIGKDRWVCFVSEQAGLLLWHQQGNCSVDSYRLMNDDMTVFGFGRKGLEARIKNRLLTSKNSFIIKLCYEKNEEEIKLFIKEARKR